MPFPHITVNVPREKGERVGKNENFESCLLHQGVDMLGR